MKFVKTNNQKDIEELRKLGFQEISKEGQYVVFLNDSRSLLSFNTKNLVFTNILTFDNGGDT